MLKKLLLSCFAASTLIISSLVFSADGGPLPSWNDTDTTKRLLSFISDVSDEDSTNYVAPSDRIAVFDNDGTLWAEKPAYFQLFFAMSQIQTMAKANPELAKEWQENPVFKAALNNDLKTAASYGEAGLLELVNESHGGVSTVEFEQAALDWIATARHPTTDKLYTDMVYQPMLELLDHLRMNDFRIYIVSGGGMDFMRPWAESVYGIPRENVIGTRMQVTYHEDDKGNPVLMREKKLEFIDDKVGKPIAIHHFIGKKPIMAVGNSDGDLQMLRWIHSNTKPNLSMYIHHTDAEREWAYDSPSHIGQLKQGLIDAKEKDWLVVDMQNNWRRIFPK